MAVPFSNTKLRVPKGFQNILEGLAREILRSQPENPFEFGAKYFEQLMRVREETGHDPAVHGARLEDRFYNNDSFKSPSVDPSSPQQQDAALTIQTNYRKHTAEQQVENMKEDEAAEKIQAGFRGYQDRQKFADLKTRKSGGIPADNREPEKGGKQEEEEEVDIDLNDPDVEKAAVKIQAGFKGFKARQEIKEMKESKQTDKLPPEPVKEEKKEEVDIDLNDPDTEKAALKIQAGFKGYQTRKDLKSKKEAQTQEVSKEDVKAPSPEATEEKKDEVDIDLKDPEVEKAAVKIQAGFKGYKTRQEIKAKIDSSETQGEEKADDKSEEKTDEAKTDADEKTEGETVDIDLNDPEVAQAATKIQAGFKGYKTRQELKQKKDSEEN